MYQNLGSIDLFNNSSIVYMRKPNNKIISWINILIIGSILFGLLSYFYEYELFNIYYAKIYKDEENNYLYFSADEEFIEVKNRNYLIVNDEEIKCHLVSFSDNYYLYSNKKFWDVKYECDLNAEININDNIVQIKYNKRKTTLLKEFFKKMKEGLKRERVRN